VPTVVVLVVLGAMLAAGPAFAVTATGDAPVVADGQHAQQLQTDLRSIGYNETATGEIDENDPRSDAFRGFPEPVSCNGTAGDAVSIDMSAADGDPFLILLGPDGGVVANNDDTPGSLNASIETTLPETGEYTIIATGFSREDTFRYSLSVRRIGGPTDGGAANESVR
jgi:serine protease Do